MKAPDKPSSTPTRLICTHKANIREAGVSMALTLPKTRTSPHSLIGFGKTGAVRKDPPKKIGSAPQQHCGAGIEPEFSGRQSGQARVCPAGPLPQIFLEPWPGIDYRRR